MGVIKVPRKGMSWAKKKLLWLQYGEEWEWGKSDVVRLAKSPAKGASRSAGERWRWIDYDSDDGDGSEKY